VNAKCYFAMICKGMTHERLHISRKSSNTNCEIFDDLRLGRSTRKFSRSRSPINMADGSIERGHPYASIEPSTSAIPLLTAELFQPEYKIRELATLAKSGKKFVSAPISREPKGPARIFLPNL
jgi:hypothetical protein